MAADTSRAAFNVRSALTLLIVLAWLAAVGYGLVSGALNFPTALATFSGPAGVVLGYWFGTSNPSNPGATS